MSTSAQLSSSQSPQFSKGVDTGRAAPDVLALTQGKWDLINERKGLHRVYKFKNFPKAMDFINIVAIRCKRHNHHPEIYNLYNIVKLTWTTHNPEGLSEIDIAMAQFCDREAKELGEVEYVPGDKCGCTTG